MAYNERLTKVGRSQESGNFMDGAYRAWLTDYKNLPKSGRDPFLTLPFMQIFTQKIMTEEI